MKTLLALLIITCVLTGCHNYNINGTRPVRYADGVQVISLDITVRPFNKTLTVFENVEAVKGRKYHKIALLTRSGWPNDEEMLVNAIIWKAKSLGASGVILLPTVQGAYQFNLGGPSGKPCFYKAEAIVFDAP